MSYGVQRGQLTWAVCTCIFCRSTVVSANSLSPTPQKSCLVPRTVHVVEENESITLTKVSSVNGESIPSTPEVQLPANHRSVPIIPLVVAHRAPVAMDAHLYSPLVGTPPRLQADVPTSAVLWRRLGTDDSGVFFMVAQKIAIF